ncbi:MAG: alanyl-tRNA editing protein [Pseudomonadota bacterium]
MKLFLENAYAREAEATVLAVTEGGILLDRTIFYANSGGQPGDTGTIDGTAIIDTRKGPEDTILHIPAPGAALPAVGDRVGLALDWDRRHRHMRMHTTLHLLCALLPGIYATGNQIGADKSRLDFDLPDPPAKEDLTERLNALIAQAHPIGTRWITGDELDAKPDLVRTLSVQPPRGAGQVRLVRIGAEDAPIDLQPCGGTHVANTAEIGRAEISKIENKGKQNRRLHIILTGEKP